jgi:hypothetical protein
LDPERFVEVVLAAKGVNNSLWRLAVAEQRRYGVAGKGEHHVIDQKGGAEENRDHL